MHLVAMATTNMATAMVGMGMGMGMVQKNKTSDSVLWHRPQTHSQSINKTATCESCIVL